MSPRSNWIIFNHASFEIDRARAARVKDMKEMGRGRRLPSRRGQGKRRERERGNRAAGKIPLLEHVDAYSDRTI